jgi:hypothetical protein
LHITEEFNAYINEYRGLGCIVPFFSSFSIIENKSDIYYKEADGNNGTILSQVWWNAIHYSVCNPLSSAGEFYQMKISAKQIFFLSFWLPSHYI